MTKQKLEVAARFSQTHPDKAAISPFIAKLCLRA
jgi:hypothetical protein